MIYRDALAALFTFGGIYAAGVLGWGLFQLGVFGIVAAGVGAVGAWAGGRADRAFGPRPVIVASIWVLIARLRRRAPHHPRQRARPAGRARTRGSPTSVFMAGRRPARRRRRARCRRPRARCSSTRPRAGSRRPRPSASSRSRAAPPPSSARR